MWRGPSRGPRGEYPPRAPPKERGAAKPTCATLAVSLSSLLSYARPFEDGGGGDCGGRRWVGVVLFVLYLLALATIFFNAICFATIFRCMRVRRGRCSGSNRFAPRMFAKLGRSSSRLRAARPPHVVSTRPPPRSEAASPTVVQLATTNHDGEHPRPTQSSCQIIRLGC